MPSAPAIGALRDRLELQASSDALDAYGQPGRTWTTYATVWARVVGQSGGESQQAGQQSAMTQYRIWIRRRTDVAPTHRALWGAKILNFLATWDEDGERSHSIITAAEVAA